MNTKMKMRIISLLLCFVMLFGLVPTSVFAAEPTEITEIKTIMSVDTVPKAGMEVTHFMPIVPDGEPYQRDWDGTDWYDSSGVKIAPTLNHHYDIGYEFEAGHTYYADYQYTADNGYVFAADPTITFTGPDPSMFTYEIVDRWDNNESVTVRYTFTIPGEFEYADINKVSMMYYGTPKDGGKRPDPCEVIYNNCTITSEEWNTGTWGSDANWGVYEEDGSNAPTFLAGESYVHMIELTAKPGYQFAQGLHVQKGTQDAEEYGVVTLSDDRTVATVKFTYNIPEIGIINTIDLVAAPQHMNFCLHSGESIYLPQPFVAKYAGADSNPYKVDSVNSSDWIVDETGEYLSLGYKHSFEVGKKYTLRFHVRIKDEYITTHKFASGLDLGLNITDYQYANSDFVEFKISGGETTATVEVTYTCQFPEGAGSSANNPAVCNSYWEFKYAMENDDIRYVALCNVEDMLPIIPHDEEQDPGGIIRTAIVVRGTKDLNLLGNAVFRCPLTKDYDLKYYIQLINLTDAANSNLYIHGPGSLTYVGGTLDFVNSVIKMEGGNLTVDGATIRGSNGYHTGFCYGINAIYGSVCIRGGATIIGENYGCYGGISALTLGSEGVNRSLSVSIFDGTFYVERDEGNSDEEYGISVNNDIGLRIYGMTTDGIKLRRYAADTLADYVMDGTVMTINGVTTDPASCGTTSGIVEVYKEISKVDIHVNAPESGKAPAMYPGDIYMVPEGVTALAPVWYENGQPWNLNSGSERFEAGKTYKVEIVLTADGGVNFAKSLTSATINYKNAEVSAFAGNWEKGIVLTVDFGECPATVSDVELNVTTPKEGNTISYSVTDSSDAYGALGSGNTITNYRAWYVSNDGSNYTRMSQGDKFVAGKYYKFSTWVRTADGYEFPLDNSLDPDVSATVNGYYARVIRAYDQDPTRVIVVEYDFGMCNDSVIENITVVDVTAPVAGEHPSYTYNILGSGYQMNTSKNAYLDVYWKNPPEKWYYIKNGISWWDVTDGGYDYVYENDTFIPGHQYQCKVYLKVEDGFEFAYNNGTPTVTATMNGNTAEITMYGSGLQWEQQVTYTFTCAQAEVSAVEVSGIDAPVAGQTPDYTGTVGNAALYGFANYGYNAAGFWWYDSEDKLLTSEDKFVAGETYKLEIKLTSAMIDQVAASRFKTPVTATLNGKAVDSSDVMANSSTVYIYQTYTCKEASAVFVSGSVTSFNDASGDITLQLIPEGLSEPAYETIVTGNTVDYYFADVAAGTYTLKVMKKNHVTREYTVVVGNSFVIQDVYLCLLGDVNGDGLLNSADYSMIVAHVKCNVVFDDVQKSAADLTRDGVVDAFDAIYLDLYLNGAVELP